jgi:hypothetical protein
MPRELSHLDGFSKGGRVDPEKNKEEKIEEEATHRRNNKKLRQLVQLVYLVSVYTPELCAVGGLGG